MKWGNMLFALLALACVGLTAVYLYVYMLTPTFRAKPSPTYSEAGYIQALVIDIGGVGDVITPENAMQETHAVLAVNLAKLPVPPGTQALPNQLQAFNGVSSLRLYDLNNDYVIDSADPVFTALEVMTMRQGNLFHQSLTAAGIRAIVINQERKQLEANPATAISADGYRWTVKEVPLNLDTLGTIPVLPSSP